MAISDHLLPLVERLQTATAENRVPWEEGASDKEFVVSFSNSSLRFFRHFDPHEQVGGLSLHILNSEGKLVDRISLDENDVGFLGLQDLYDAARRAARKADEVLKDLLGELGE